MNRKLFVWSVIPICLFLISMGIRVPNLSNLHPPKPRPQAILETTSKTSQDSTTNQVVAVELCDNLPALLSPEIFRSRFPGAVYKFSSIPHSPRSARAPPVLFS
jgi:hypothetical protein